MNPVAVDDLVRRWRELSAEETVLAQAYLDDAWEELLMQIPGIDTRLTGGTLRPGLVVAKVVAVVKAVMQNPEGYLEEAIDDWRGRRDAATSTGRIRFSEEDLAALREVPNVTARSVRMGY